MRAIKPRVLTNVPSVELVSNWDKESCHFRWINLVSLGRSGWEGDAKAPFIAEALERIVPRNFLTLKKKYR